jgi:hypothetical protein
VVISFRGMRRLLLTANRLPLDIYIYILKICLYLVIWICNVFDLYLDLQCFGFGFVCILLLICNVLNLNLDL